MHRLPATDPRNWRNQALIHINRCRHGARDFLHWHRWYIFYFEKICGELIGDPSFTLPYWNWSANGGIIPAPFYNRPALNVEFWKDPSDAQSDSWGPDPVTTIGVRGLGRGQRLQDDPDVGQSFTQAAINSIKQQRNFGVFTNQLETSPHNNAHNLVGGDGGHMGNGMSPLDPIFWLHHCNVDRLWAEWQAAGHATPALNISYDNQFVGRLGRPQRASSTAAINLALFDYAYDTLGHRAAPEIAQEAPASGGSAEPRILARDAVTKIAVTGLQIVYNVTAKDLMAALIDSRSARAAILAHIRLVPPAKATPVTCKVFVNCPNLTPATPTSDIHYAGCFSLFGPNSNRQEKSYIVDITGPLKALTESGATLHNLNLQIMPLYAKDKSAVQPVFEVRQLEILES